MTFWMKALGCLSVRSQKKLITGHKAPVMQAIYIFDHAMIQAAHVARDQVPLRRTLQIRFTRLSQSLGSRKSNVENIWRHEWDSSQRLLPHRSAG